MLMGYDSCFAKLGHHSPLRLVDIMLVVFVRYAKRRFCFSTVRLAGLAGLASATFRSWCHT